MTIVVFTVSDFNRCFRISKIYRIIKMQISIFTEITSELRH